MISYLTSADMSIIAFIGVIFAFALTCIAIAKLNKFLPKDLGRQFAVDGKLSAGKPRGAGIIFIFTFVISAVLFSQINVEIVIYLVLIVMKLLRKRLLKIIQIQSMMNFMGIGSKAMLLMNMLVVILF